MKRVFRFLLVLGLGCCVIVTALVVIGGGLAMLVPVPEPVPMPQASEDVLDVVMTSYAIGVASQKDDPDKRIEKLIEQLRGQTRAVWLYNGVAIVPNYVERKLDMMCDQFRLETAMHQSVVEKNNEK